MSDPGTADSEGSIFFSKVFEPPFALKDGQAIEFQIARLSSGRVHRVDLLIVERDQVESLKLRAEAAADQLLGEVVELGVMGLEFSAWATGLGKRGLLKFGEWVQR